MKKAEEMMSQYQKMQDQLKDSRYIGTSGGGLVSVTLNHEYVVLELKIDDSLLKDNDPDLLEDLVKVAFNEAGKKVQEESNKSVAGIMPSGLKMPF